MWRIIVQCISAATTCGISQPHIPLEVGWYTSRTQCEDRIVDVARAWNPGRGTYTFNCRRAI